jgi:16S rRNA (cytosine967-C5)-methyltransferase
MGAVQLLILKTGAHAAVDSTVELMRQSGFERLCGMANAVMRRLTREGDARFETTTAIDNLPDWLLQSWNAHWGHDATSKLADMAMNPPPLDISAKADPKNMVDKLEGTLIDDYTIRRAFDGDPSRLAGFAEGEWWVQDAAAALPARLFGDIKGKDVIDLCAAPGGKTAQLIAAGATVTAIDSGRKRIDRLRRNLKRLDMTATLKQVDGRKFVPDMPVDAILLDAPCSATGTLRRRPDILGRRQPEDIESLQNLQWELATTALGWLKAGGTLVYATCSLQPEEGEDMITAIIDAGENKIVIDPITPDQAGMFARSLTQDGTLRILPHQYEDIGGVDGFFAARLIALV